jgi:hypothetical protein
MSSEDLTTLIDVLQRNKDNLAIEDMTILINLLIKFLKNSNLDYYYSDDIKENIALITNGKIIDYYLRNIRPKRQIEKENFHFIKDEFLEELKKRGCFDFIFSIEINCGCYSLGYSMWVGGCEIKIEGILNKEHTIESINEIVELFFDENEW